MIVELSERAKSDLRSILIEVARDNRDAALALSARFAERFEQLAKFPELGRPRPEFAANLRGLLVVPYIVFYLPAPNRISVARILHTSRDLRRAFAK